ncbi:MAG: hypothetical protein PHF79_01815 [Candidatus Pacebacteria bacterium]|nr:hypothetical protein [Candidatus Paceibacterota bacterium]
MSPDGTITELNINGEEDPDVPVAGIPYPKSGIRTSFYLTVNAFDKYGTYIGYGFFTSDVLKKGDPIVVKLQPASVRNTLTFSVPAGVNPNNLVLETTDNGGDWNYNPRDGGFTFWSDPVTGVGYRIVDESTGIVYEIGDIPPFQPTTTSSNDSLVNIGYEAGVVAVTFTPTQGYVYRQFQQLDGSITDPSTGKEVVAKVYMTRLGGNGLNIYLSGIKGTVTVKQWLPADQGDLPIISTVDTAPNPYDGTYNGGLSTPRGFDKVIIEVTGEVQDPSVGFNISFSNFADGGRG